MSYTVPQVQVFQEFKQAPTAVVNNQNAFIVGPHYHLMRHSAAAEKPLIDVGAYNKDASEGIGYPALPTSSIVDQAYVKLFADNAALEYYDIPVSADALVAVSAASLNKLRAMPKIVDNAHLNAAMAIAPAGYHTGLIDLPEAYYMFPAAKFTVGSEAGTLNWLTTEDLQGTTNVPANATRSGVRVQGPHGVVFNFGSPGAVKTIGAIKLADVTGTSDFTITVRKSTKDERAELRALMDAASADAAKTLKVTITNGSVFASFDDINNELTLTYTSGVTTLTSLRTAVLNIGATFDGVFAVSAISGTASAAITSCKDVANADAAISSTYTLISAFAKFTVYANNYTFKTADGHTRTPGLNKDVEVGDLVAWTVTPASTGIEVSGVSKVAGLEADMSMPYADAPAYDAVNQGAVIGTDLTTVDTSLVAMGADNQRAHDFDGARTGVYALDAAVGGVVSEMLPSYANKLLSSTVTIAITRGGTPTGDLVAGPLCTVSYADGSYRRINVPVELDGDGYSQVYIGNNMVVILQAGATTIDNGKFYVGDTYVVGPVKATAAAVTGLTVDGTFVGEVDTTYTAEVTRGGVFNRAVVADLGVTMVYAADVVLHASIADWKAGDVDDEYILKVAVTGSISTAVFSLTSQRGDDVSGISFSDFGSTSALSLGASGLSLYFAHTATTGDIFTTGDYWVISVKAARPRVRVTDSAGMDQESSVVVIDNVPTLLGLNGLTLTFPANSNNMADLTTGGGLFLGDKFAVAAHASKAGAYKTIVLADDITATAVPGIAADGTHNYAPDSIAVKLDLVVNSIQVPSKDYDPSVAPGGYNFIPGALSTTVEAGITVQNPRVVDSMGDMPYLPLISAELYLEYRSLLQDYAGSIYSLADVGLVEADLGPADPDNPLALGVLKALENAGTAPVRFTAIPTDDQRGYELALAKASLTTSVYGCVPLSESPSIHDLFEGHINNMSTAQKKQWRIAWFGNAVPTTSPVLTPATNPSGVPWMATVTADTTGAFKKVTLTESGSLVANMKAGDSVRLGFTTDAWGDETYSTDVVASVESNTVFHLVGGLPSAVATAQRVESYHPLSVPELAAAVAAQSSRYASRRCYNVFPGRLGDGTYTGLSAIYAACAVAGLKSSVVPHQGLTNVELVGFTDVPLVYNTLSYDDLNTIAAGGTFIIMQDTLGGAIYVRHQISTAYVDGNLNTSELSRTTNLDSISYYFTDLLKPFIGRYNVTPTLIQVIGTELQAGIAYLGSYTAVGLLGPQVILDDPANPTQIKTLAQHPTLKDRIYAVLELNLPYPLNTIELHLVV